jgi:hypothetical protein
MLGLMTMVCPGFTKRDIPPSISMALRVSSGAVLFLTRTQEGLVPAEKHV